MFHNSGQVTLSWQVSDTTNIKYYKIYLSDSLHGVYAIWDSTATATSSKSISGLTTGNLYYLKVSAVVTENLEGTLSSAIRVQTGPISLIINNNDDYTRSQLVDISFVIPVTAALVQVSENSDFVDAYWVNYSPTISKTLSLGDGIKRLYARILFADGSESVDIISDSIILDTKAIIDTAYFHVMAQFPIDSTYLNHGAIELSQSDDMIYFFMDCDEKDGRATVSFQGISSMELFDDGTNGDLFPDDGIYTRSFSPPSNIEIIDGVVIGRFTDAAGNVAEERAFPYPLNISRAPSAVSLIAGAESSSSIRLSWTQNHDNDFSAYHIYRDTLEEVTTGSKLVTTISTSATLTYIDSDLDENTAYYYIIFVYDNTGLSAGSLVESDTTFANVAPTAVKLALQVQDSLSSLSWTANDDEDFGFYQIYRDTLPNISENGGRLLGIINNSSSTTFSDIRPDSLTYYYRVFVYDKQGMSSGSNEVSAP
jgi:uncharacterized protein YcfL